MRITLLILFIIGGLSVLSSVSGRQHKTNSLQTKDTRMHNRTEERLEISFKFQRGGIASSQYAIWIENDEGQLVRTIYTTSFTAKGGYKYRKDAIPFWVSKANPKDMSSEQVDAITGATPRNGILVYQWDGTTMSLREIISFLSKARCIGRAGLYILENLRGGTKN